MEGGDGWIKTSLHFLIKGCNDNICQGRISFLHNAFLSLIIPLMVNMSAGGRGRWWCER